MYVGAVEFVVPNIPFCCHFRALTIININNSIESSLIHTHTPKKNGRSTLWWSMIWCVHCTAQNVLRVNFHIIYTTYWLYHIIHHTYARYRITDPWATSQRCNCVSLVNCLLRGVVACAKCREFSSTTTQHYVANAKSGERQYIWVVISSSISALVCVVLHSIEINWWTNLPLFRMLYKSLKQKKWFVLICRKGNMYEYIV